MKKQWKKPVLQSLTVDKTSLENRGNHVPDCIDGSDSMPFGQSKECGDGGLGS